MGKLSDYQRKGRYAGKYDTPTDGISRKVFDRYKDKQARLYTAYTNRVLDLERQVADLWAHVSIVEEE